MAVTPTARPDEEVRPVLDSPARPTTTVTVRSDVHRSLRAASGALVAFVALTAAVLTGSTGWLDEVGRPLAGWATTQGLDPLLLHVEVAFGRSAMIAYAVLVVVALLAFRVPRLAAFAAVVTLSNAQATGAIKDLVGRVRPEWQLADHSYSTFAFPSGHTSSVTALVGVLVIVTWSLTATHVARQTITSLVAGVGVALVVIVAADRVLLGRHYPTDVIGGALLATSIVLVSAVALGLVGRELPVSSDDPATPEESERGRLVALAA